MLFQGGLLSILAKIAESTAHINKIISVLFKENMLIIVFLVRFLA